MKNNKGFTLIEMLVVVAVIATLSVSMGISANKVAQNAKISDYESTMYDIFNAASISLDLRVMPENCNNKFVWDSLPNDSTLEIKISCLVEKGLLDENIYQTNNPMYSNGKTFSKEGIINVDKTSEGEKKLYITCINDTNKNLSFDNLYDYKYWGEC